MKSILVTVLLSGFSFVGFPAFSDEIADNERDRALELVESEEEAGSDDYTHDDYNADLDAIDDAEREREED